jgi:hypothetical protein
MRRIALVLVLVGLVAAASPPVRSQAKAGMLTLEMLGSPVRPLSWLTPAPHERELQLPTTTADLYRARGFSSQAGIVLVHGANPGGKDDPRVVDLARALARTGREVLVPQLNLRHERLDPEDPERILDAIGHLAVRGQVGVLAFSYGGALTLVALGDQPSAQDDVRFVATVGTYYDVAHIVQGATTGTVPSPEGDVGWDEADPRAREIVAHQLAFLLGGEDQQELERAIERRDPEGLGPEARAAYDLASNRDPDRFAALMARLPDRIRQVADDLSPSRVVDRIGVPLLALHALDDPAAPPTESRLLVEDLRDRVDTVLVEVGILQHVTPTPAGLRSLGDGLRVARFAGRVLSAHEGWPRL